MSGRALLGDRLIIVEWKSNWRLKKSSSHENVTLSSRNGVLIRNTRGIVQCWTAATPPTSDSTLTNAWSITLIDFDVRCNLKAIWQKIDHSMPWVIECGRSLNSREEKLSNFDGSKLQSWETFFINFDLSLFRWLWMFSSRSKSLCRRVYVDLNPHFHLSMMKWFRAGSFMTFL